MYGVAVNLIMSVSGHPSIINEIEVLNLFCRSIFFPAIKEDQFALLVYRHFPHLIENLILVNILDL